MVYPLQEKLHISGMDDRAPSLARRWRLGCEDITFSYAPMLDDPAALPQAANRHSAPAAARAAALRRWFMGASSYPAGGAHRPKKSQGSPRGSVQAVALLYNITGRFSMACPGEKMARRRRFVL